MSFGCTWIPPAGTHNWLTRQLDHSSIRRHSSWLDELAVTGRHWRGCLTASARRGDRSHGSGCLMTVWTSDTHTAVSHGAWEMTPQCKSRTATCFATFDLSGNVRDAGDNTRRFFVPRNECISFHYYVEL